MAVQRSPAELKEMAVFVHQLYERSGCARWNEFADRAGLPSEMVSRYANARAMPDGYNLLRLIRAAGEEPATVQAPATGPQAAVIGLLRELGDAIGDLAVAVERIPQRIGEDQRTASSHATPQ